MARKKKRTNNTFFLYLSIVTILVLVWVNHNSKKMEILYANEYKKTYEVEAIMIKNEAVMNLKDKIDFSVKEGERVSINQVLSDSKNIAFSEYYNREIDMINWLIDNDAYREKNIFDKDITNIDKQLDKIEKKLKWAKNFDNEDKIKDLNKQKDELVKKKYYIIRSFQYMGTSKEELITLKEKYSDMKDSTGSSITLNKLNFGFPGYIYFHSDGYENLLTTNVLQYLTPEFIANIDKYNKSNDNSRGQTVKVVDDSYMYLGIVVPNDEVFAQEERVLERKDEIMKSIKLDGLNEYYAYLNSRVDKLRSLPKIDFQYDKTQNSGYIVDVREFGEEKIILIECKDDINSKIFTERNITVDLFTYVRDGYLIPAKSIVKVDEKDNIVILSKGYLKKYVEVKVTRKDGKNVFLETSENENITDGMQLIINP